MSGLTSGDWKRSNGPNDEAPAKTKVAGKQLLSTPTATAPVVDFTELDVAVIKEADEAALVPWAVADDPGRIHKRRCRRRAARQARSRPLIDALKNLLRASAHAALGHGSQEICLEPLI